MKKLCKYIDENKVVLICLFIYSFLVYSYAGFNTIINLDGVDDFIVVNKISDYTLYLSVGRWGWSLIGLLFSYYPSPLICLFINCIMFSLSGVYIGKLFNIEKKIYIILISMIMIAFPINVIAYTYLPWEYSIGIAYFVCIYSVYLIFNLKKVRDYVLPIILLAFATGIYQIFLELIIVLCVGVLINYYCNTKNAKLLFKKMLSFIIYGIIGMIAYYLITKLSILLFNIEMNSYQGANTMFILDIKTFVSSFLLSFVSCFKVDFGYFFSDVSHYILIIILLLGIISGLFNLKQKNWSLYILLIILLIISPKLLNFFKPFVWYHSITLIPYSILYVCGICILLNNLKNIKSVKLFNIVNKMLIVLLVICSFYFLVNANKALIMAKNSSDASFYYLDRLQTRIEMLDGYSSLPNQKEYYIYKRNYSSLSSFPFSKNAYVKEQGVTWSVINGTEDIISAINLLGENVIEARLSEHEKKVINSEINSRKSYPNSEGIFIYNDIVVIILDLES